MRCPCCNQSHYNPGKWCKRPKCQKDKQKYQRLERMRIQKEHRGQYKTFVSDRHNKLNGRHCKVEGCGIALKGDYWYRCPRHAAIADDYGMQTNVCL